MWRGYKTACQRIRTQRNSSSETQTVSLSLSFPILKPVLQKKAPQKKVPVKQFERDVVQKQVSLVIRGPLFLAFQCLFASKSTKSADNRRKYPWITNLVLNNEASDSQNGDFHSDSSLSFTG